LPDTARVDVAAATFVGRTIPRLPAATKAARAKKTTRSRGLITHD
jgi:hypothetical protein